MDNLRDGQRLSMMLLKRIKDARIGCGFSLVTIPFMNDEQSNELEAIFTDDKNSIRDPAAREIQDKYYQLCREIRPESGESIADHENLTVVVDDEQIELATTVIQKMRELSDQLTDFYFPNVQPRRGPEPSRAEKLHLIEQYQLLATDEEKLRFLVSDRPGINKYNNWKVKCIFEAGVGLPQEAYDAHVGQAATASPDINGNLFDFHICASYIIKNFKLEEARTALIYLELTNGATKRQLEPFVQPFFKNYFATNENALLVPGYRLTKAKLISSLILIVHKMAGSIAALTFPEINRSVAVIDLLNTLLDVQADFPMNEDTASVKNLVNNSVRKFFSPRSYWLGDFRTSITDYIVNGKTTLWYYFTNIDLLTKIGDDLSDLKFDSSTLSAVRKYLKRCSPPHEKHADKSKPGEQLPKGPKVKQQDKESERKIQAAQIENEVKELSTKVAMTQMKIQKTKGQAERQELRKELAVLSQARATAEKALKEVMTGDEEIVGAAASQEVTSVS